MHDIFLLISHNGLYVFDFNPDYKCVALWFFTDRGERKLTSKKDIEIYSTTKNASKIITVSKSWANDLLNISGINPIVSNNGFASTDF